MPQIMTYVFIDLEATGLPKDENNQTKITELSFVAVSRKHLLLTRRGQTPRVQNKLTFCFNPERPIRPHAKNLSGLSNTLLEEELVFDGEICRLMETFLSLLKKPVCMVSQGGNFLDFPLLKKQLIQANVSLPADVRCVDSLDVFYCVMEGANAVGTSFPYGVNIKLGRSFKLQDVYRRLLGRAPPKAHRAEADCLLVLTCAVALGDKFVDWVDGHSKRFSEEKPLGD